MKKWQCQVCRKENCWSLIEQNYGPLMCMVCWEWKKLIKEMGRFEALARAKIVRQEKKGRDEE